MYIEQINSTNTYLREHPDEDMVYTAFQTAGRGQMGNGWESEKGKNVLLSVRLRPQQVLAQEQWQVCMQVSVLLWQVVAEYVDKSNLAIKWPNDLYYGDKKIAGVLIEHTLRGGYIAESIIGIGLNVNQTQWQGTAPNPVSIKQISGKENRVDEIVEQLTGKLLKIDATSANWGNLYLEHLYRREGWYWWEERDVDTQPTMNAEKSEQSFIARIADITSQGELVLHRRNNEEKKYHFKQIKYIL